MGTLALTGKPYMQEPFLPMVPGVEFIDSTIEALEAALDDRVAALFVEPIKGEAGVIDLPEGYLAAARELTAAHGALLIIDEIQTGAGRTGEWFAFQHAGITPDAITVAKGIGGGFPIGALITFGAAQRAVLPGDARLDIRRQRPRHRRLVGRARRDRGRRARAQRRRAGSPAARRDRGDRQRRSSPDAAARGS